MNRMLPVLRSTTIQSVTARYHSVLLPDYIRLVSAASPQPLSHHVWLGASDAVSAARYLWHTVSRYWYGAHSQNAQYHIVQTSIGMGNPCISADLSATGMGAKKRAVARSVFWLGIGNEQSHRDRSQLGQGGT